MLTIEKPVCVAHFETEADAYKFALGIGPGLWSNGPRLDIMEFRWVVIVYRIN